ncbi:hypothetical protein GGTG_01058 [Gaeumannomyces tritici R3-111a-1]|uniref:Uncharacterized protein n=1 Tax=Gaeumannomyces tritici (strain R3-111a-1) TaxID=644352 RepID=J3NIH8_GAET3|nr:hypothetical protein GGTG_01058 [Gaeumannomyces tritici R3-111a-1]EJT81071.1 hypothetical protein GGTG_01058 [Gaeumannomyces tritici R3-111a-1]
MDATLPVPSCSPGWIPLFPFVRACNRRPCRRHRGPVYSGACIALPRGGLEPATRDDGVFNRQAPEGLPAAVSIVASRGRVWAAICHAGGWCEGCE